MLRDELYSSDIELDAAIKKRHDTLYETVNDLQKTIVNIIKNKSESDFFIITQYYGFIQRAMDCYTELELLTGEKMRRQKVGKGPEK